MRKFPAKVLLFGEHTILRGSRALVVPLWARHSYWRSGGTPEEQGDLVAFADYLAEYFPGWFAIDALRKDLAAGRYLASNVPVGYGLGSSGAVCVAVFQTYATEAGRARLAETGEKAFLARMESFFHGNSSGTDPLLIYLERPVQLFPGGRWESTRPAALPPGWRFFLLDTGRARKTAPLVDYFTRRFDAEEAFRAQVQKEWMAPSDAAIDACVTGAAADLWAHFRTVSQFQIEHLPPMILPSIETVWRQGLASDHYLLKICGAGGGGYCLGLSKDWARTREALREWALIEVMG